MYHPVQTSVACEESTCKVRERGLVSEGNAFASSRLGGLYEEKPRVRKAEKHRRDAVKKRKSLKRTKSGVARLASPQEEKSKRQIGQKSRAEGYKGGENRGRGWERENRGARRRRRRVPERSCGDGECASGWKTIEASASLSIDERLSSATARLDFRSPRFPP
eukprot:891687-Pleurochrysis_carterae.AAC.1